MSSHPTVAVTAFCFGAMPNAIAAGMRASRETARRCADYNRAIALHQQADAMLARSRIALAQSKAAAPRGAAADELRLKAAVRKVLG